MALETYQYSQNYNLYDYSTALKSKVLLSGEHKYFTSVITGQVSPVHVIGDGSTALSGLPFIERLDIYAAANVDLEDLRITGNKVKIHNSSAATITVQTGTTGTPTTENINPKCNVEAFFDGTYWRVEDGAQIGDIKPWHKSFNGGTLSLPWGWVEMDGATLSDAESPFNGATLEDLNGDGRFLRGAATSGTEQADAMQGHMHYQGMTRGDNTGSTFNAARGGGSSVGAYDVGNAVPSTDGVNGVPRTASETRPVNMSVVWILKIK